MFFLLIFAATYYDAICYGFFFQHNEYRQVMGAFKALDFSQSAVDSIWNLVAAVMHIGNLEFANKEDSDELVITDRYNNNNNNNNSSSSSNNNNNNKKQHKDLDARFEKRVYKKESNVDLYYGERCIDLGQIFRSNHWTLDFWFFGIVGIFFMGLLLGGIACLMYFTTP